MASPRVLLIIKRSRDCLVIRWEYKFPLEASKKKLVWHRGRVQVAHLARFSEQLPCFRTAALLGGTTIKRVSKQQAPLRSPLRVSEREDRTFHVSPERSGNAPLDEVEEMNLAVHAAGYGRVEVGDVAHAGYSAGVHRQGVVSVELGGLASVLEAYMYA